MGVERTVSDETEQPSRCESMKDFAYHNQRLEITLCTMGMSVKNPGEGMVMTRFPY